MPMHKEVITMETNTLYTQEVEEENKRVDEEAEISTKEAIKYLIFISFGIIISVICIAVGLSLGIFAK